MITKMNIHISTEKTCIHASWFDYLMYTADHNGLKASSFYTEHIIMYIITHTEVL